MADAAIHGHTEDKRGFFTRWFMSTNHKDIGILYLFVGGFLGFLSVSFTIYMRMELMYPGVQYMCMEGARLTAAATVAATAAASAASSAPSGRVERTCPCFQDPIFVAHLPL